MQLSDYQTYLKLTGRYSGAIDGAWGKLTEAGTLQLLTDGPDTALGESDFDYAADELNCSLAQIRGVTDVEANGAGFMKGRPMILPEPHRFSRSTRGRYDAAYPYISYPTWGTHPYPATQDARYARLLGMIQLDILAGFASASYGRFQILGENARACGHPNSMRFAEAMARDELSQLRAFISFLTHTGIVEDLRRCTSDPETCRHFARRYNGTAYARNNYHVKIAEAIARRT